MKKEYDILVSGPVSLEQNIDYLKTDAAETEILTGLTDRAKALFWIITNKLFDF